MEEPDWKVCTACQQPRPLNEFNRRGEKLRAQCRQCDAAYMAEWRKANREREKIYHAEYRESHQEERKEAFKQWYDRDREKQVERSRQYREQHQEILLQKRIERREAERERYAQYRQKYPERCKTTKAAYREQNREKIRVQGRIYHAKNKEAIMQRKSAYAQTPRGKTVRRIIRQRYLARKANAPGTFTVEQFLGRCDYYGWCCYLCGTLLTPETVIIEHRIPLSRNGTNWSANLAPSCELCNLRKATKTELEFREQMRRESLENPLSSSVQ